jgi:DNA modification methylase
MNNLTIIQGDCREMLKTLPEASVQCCVTSPPYFGLRDYGVAGQIGLEPTPAEYVAAMVEVFREVWRVLRDDGTLWLNLGDSYAGSGKGGNPDHGSSKQSTNSGSQSVGVLYGKVGDTARQAAVTNVTRKTFYGIKAKDLIGIPWMVAFALRDAGWYLRSEITWCKRAPMPESVTDRPTSATEKLFLLTKSPYYYYDADAIRNPPSEAMLKQVAEGYNGQATKLFEDNGVQNASDVKSRIIANARKRVDKQRGHSRRHAGFNDRWDGMTKEEQMACGSNMRNYWLLGPEPFTEAHFATFPSEIPRRCILAGTKPGDVVLDPFGGSGTTGMVALELARKAILIELNPEYAAMADQRCNVTPGLAIA